MLKQAMHVILKFLLCVYVWFMCTWVCVEVTGQPPVRFTLLLCCLSLKPHLNLDTIISLELFDQWLDFTQFTSLKYLHCSNH